MTLGARQAARLGGHVDIGAGAKLLGGIVVGDDALIGANSRARRRAVSARDRSARFPPWWWLRTALGLRERRSG